MDHGGGTHQPPEFDSNSLPATRNSMHAFVVQYGSIKFASNIKKFNITNGHVVGVVVNFLFSFNNNKMNIWPNKYLSLFMTLLHQLKTLIITSTLDNN